MNELLKKRIDALGRLRVANQLGWSYSTLTNKMGGYCGLIDGDIEKIEIACTFLELAKAVPA